MFLIEKSVEFYSFYDCNTLICVVIIVKSVEFYINWVIK